LNGTRGGKFSKEIYMDVDYMLACGLAWRRTADPVAGWELIEGLESNDPCIQEIAKTILVQCGEPSMSLLESAVAAGIVSPKSAVPCMAEILGAHSQADFVVFGRSVN
jgi:hypothetical protein